MMKHICLNPLCSSELPVNKKSPGQKYCNKKCWSEHREYLRTECSKKCENPACNNIIKHKKESVRKFCSNSCSATVSNFSVKGTTRSYEETQKNLSSIYFGMDTLNLSILHIEKFLDDMILYRKLYNKSISNIRSLFNFPHSSSSWFSEFYTRENILLQNRSKKIIRKIQTKRKNRKPEYPHTRIFLCRCKSRHCDNIFYHSSKKKFCKKHFDQYSDINRNQYGFKFNVFHFPDLFDLDLLKEKGFYNSKNTKTRDKNLNGLSRDHKVSVADARKYNYDPYYISHVMNCDLIPHAENNRKNTRSSITYLELVELVNEYDKRRA